MFNWKKNIKTKEDALKAIVSLEEYLRDAENENSEYDYQILAVAAIKIAKYAETLTK